MRRREVIAGLGALGIFGAGGVAYSGAVDNSFGSGEQIEPVEIHRLDDPDAPSGGVADATSSITFGSPGGCGAATELVSLPERGQPTFISLFATWCGSCEAKMGPLAEVAPEFTDSMQFVSVTNEPIGQSTSAGDVLEWWDEHDGDWPLLHDEALALTREIGAQGVPYSALFDADNRLVWSDSGYKSADELRTQLDSVV